MIKARRIDECLEHALARGVDDARAPPGFRLSGE